MCIIFCFFFFQAEDGIRDIGVTGVQTCALPIFEPDLILSQNGCDAHALDPLTHLSATMRLYEHVPRRVHDLAHELCEGRWVATGGGGYDIWRVVPRAWTVLWAEIGRAHV